MKFTSIEDSGFGSGWRLGWGWFQMDWTRFEDHWYFQILWAKPLDIKLK